MRRRTHWGALLAAAVACFAGGGVFAASADAAPAGSLAVHVTHLPVGARARVTVSGRGGEQTVSRTTMLHLAPGSYRVAARPVDGDSGSRYYPALATQTVRVKRGKTATAEVDYATIVPRTTHVVAPAALVALSGKAGGTQTLSLRGKAAAGFGVGDVVAAGRSRVTPSGLLVRVAKLLGGGSKVTKLRVSQATLAQALPRSVVDARLSAGDPLAPVEVPCGGATATLTAALGTGLRMHLETGGAHPHLTVASFELAPLAKTGLALRAGDGGHCDVSRSLSASPPPVTVHAGPIPLVLVPRVDATVHITGDFVPGVKATAIQTVTGTVGLDLEAGHWTSSVHLARTTDHSLDDAAPPPAGGTNLTATVEPSAAVLLAGLAGPHLALADSPSLAFSPATDLALAHTTTANLDLGRDLGPLGPARAPPAAKVLDVAETLDHRTLGTLGPADRPDSATQVFSGSTGTCALPQSGRLFCWGVGDVAKAGSITPTPIAIPERVRSAAVGDEHACAVTEGGAVYCWGRDDEGEVGDGIRHTEQALPTAVQEISDAVGVSAGAAHTCALLADGTVRCWGRGVSGELGTGATGAETKSLVPVQVKGITTAIQINSDEQQTCALLADGSVTCWGIVSGNGQPPHSSGTPTVVNMPAAVQVSTGRNHACAVLRSGFIYCWGNDGAGQLGDNGPSFAYTPIPVDLEFIGHPAVAVSAGGEHTCAILDDRSVDCWGRGEYGALGNATTQPMAKRPVPVSGMSGAVGLSVGGEHVCAVRRSGEVDCWGWNRYGQLGTGTDVNALRPRAVAGLTGARQVTAGGCALLSSGGVDCWGPNQQLQLGTGTVFEPSSVPVPVQGIASAIEIGSSRLRNCALLAGGTVECWGEMMAPHPVAGISAAVQISIGEYTACARRGDGTILCWGAGSQGQLGDGKFEGSTTPVQVSGITTADEVTVGAEHVCALLAGGGVDCWGSGFYGQLGDGNMGNAAKSNVPVPVKGISPAAPARQVSAGRLHTCAVMLAGTVECWGRGVAGELGNGMKVNDPEPSLVSGIADAVSIGAGEGGTCAVRAGGGLSCWGVDGFGGLGTGGNAILVVPADVANVAPAAEFDTTGATSCVRHPDGTAVCFGRGPEGEIGDGATGFAETPQRVVGLPEE